MISPFPSQVKDVPYGKALFASKDLKEGSIVEQFTGDIVEYDSLSDYDKCYVLNFCRPGSSKWEWLLPKSNARFANHSCNPNCFINDKLELETSRPLKSGEEITFIYNVGTEQDYWDPIWSFKCCCGAPNCQGMIDRYRPRK